MYSNINNMPYYYQNIPKYYPVNNIRGNNRLGGFILPFALGFASGPLVLGGLGGYPRPNYYPYQPYPYYPRPF